MFGKNIQNYAGLVWRPDFWDVLLNISGPGVYFSKPILALKPWIQAGRFNPKNLFFDPVVKFNLE